MAAKHEPALGDRVRISRGSLEHVGTVVEVYGPREERWVVVDVEYHGASGEVLTTVRGSYRLADVTLIERAPTA